MGGREVGDREGEVVGERDRRRKGWDGVRKTEKQSVERKYRRERERARVRERERERQCVHS